MILELDTEEDQDISVANVFAVFSVRLEETNNDDEESLNEAEDESEDFIEETAKR
jgi:hypothetical protein